MYSYEIDSIMKQNDYRISANTYINICSTSPQIIRTHYDAFGDYFEIWTEDRYYWKFMVERKEQTL